MRILTAKSESEPTGESVLMATRPRFPSWLPAMLLALLTIALYWPATRCGFISFDDPDYVTANPHIQGGLKWESVKWAFYNPVSFNWHPVTVISHMLVYQIFGLNPWGHHLINVLLHAFNATLVFVLLKQMTGAIWRSLLVTALFAFHPLHVESVVWVSERKDVLSGFFGLLALIFYTRYVQKSEAGSRRSEAENPDSDFRPLTSGFYWLSLLFFTLGLMSKPMLVTWPFVMLLLDYWPLHRLEQLTFNSKLSTIVRLILEKIPFFALTVAASVVTYMVQKRTGSLMTIESLPLGARVGNALISYCRYLGKMIWPVDLAVFYPHPGYWPLAEVLLAGVFLFGISVLLFVKRRQCPFMLMGWLWFCGMLVPMIGLVQTGSQALADRHTYLPSLGLLILTVWGAYELSRWWRCHEIALSIIGSAVIILFIGLTRQQLGYWKDNETLFRHALAVTENNYMAHWAFGDALLDKGQTDEAMDHFQEAIRLKPDYGPAHISLGIAFVKRSQTDKAIAQFQEAIRLKPDDAYAHGNLGIALGKNGQINEAISQFQEAIRFKPDDAEAHYDLGIAFAGENQIDEAIAQFQEAIRLKPDYADAHYNLGLIFGKKGESDEAIHQFQETIRLKPDFASTHNPIALNNLAWDLATNPNARIRNGTLAVKLAEGACEQTHYQQTIMIGTLAAAYAEAGRFGEAIATGQRACALASKLGETNLLQRNQDMVILYKAHQPYHEPQPNSDDSNLR